MTVLEDLVVWANLLAALVVSVPAVLGAAALVSKRARAFFLRPIARIEAKVDEVADGIEAIKHRQYALIVTRDEPDNLNVDAIREENDVDVEKLNKYLEDDRHVLRGGSETGGD